MPNSLKKGPQGAEVRTLQRLLNDHGYPVGIDGDFGLKTYRAVRAFQSQNLDQHGQPLVVDGKVGPITWWSLTHPKPSIETPSVIDFLRLPANTLGGSKVGRAALAMAISEMKKDAGEIGGNNSGPLGPKISEWTRSGGKLLVCRICQLVLRAAAEDNAIPIHSECTEHPATMQGQWLGLST